MTEITEAEFKQRLADLKSQRKTDAAGCCIAGLLGPFVHSAPRGNFHSGPFHKKAWTLKGETVLAENTSEGETKYYEQTNFSH